MKLVRTSSRLALLAISCATISACGQPETLRSVSDFCLNDRRLTTSVPGEAEDDPGNQWDTFDTVLQIFAHNEVHDRLCPPVTTPR